MANQTSYNPDVWFATVHIQPHQPQEASPFPSPYMQTNGLHRELHMFKSLFIVSSVFKRVKRIRKLR